VTGVFLNVGAGEDWSFAPPPWINIDIRPKVRPDVVADVLDLPFANESAAAIYAGHVLEHLERDEVDIAAGELIRVLEPGARILVVGPDTERSDRMFAAGLITADRHCSNGCHGEPGNPCVHHWACTPGEIIRSLEDAGFVDVAEILITQTPAEFPVFDRVTADQFAVLGRKPCESTS
jgi:predicted SAM-dependent methyltransferase